MQVITLKHNTALTGRRSVERFGDFGHVGDDCLDAVAFALDFRDEARHLVAATLVPISLSTRQHSTDRKRPRRYD